MKKFWLVWLESGLVFTVCCSWSHVFVFFFLRSGNWSLSLPSHSPERCFSSSVVLLHHVHWSCLKLSCLFWLNTFFPKFSNIVHVETVRKCVISKMHLLHGAARVTSPNRNSISSLFKALNNLSMTYIYFNLRTTSSCSMSWNWIIVCGGKIMCRSRAMLLRAPQTLKGMKSMTALLVSKSLFPLYYGHLMWFL